MLFYCYMKIIFNIKLFEVTTIEDIYLSKYVLNYSITTFSTEISSLRNAEADSENFVSDSVVMNLHLPFFVQRVSISGCLLK